MTSSNLGASKDAIGHHYDAGNDFYATWLDESMTYSGAIFSNDDPSESLESAQARKNDFHVRQAHAVGAERVLDIGCGWGSLLNRLVGVHGVERAIGLTLSDAQAEWIGERPDSRIDVKLESWEDHRPDAPYDAIISVGAMEHFAKPEISISEKIDAYRNFFTRCHEWLKPGGWISLQAIAYGNMKREDFKNSFVARDIFPESEFVRLAEVAEASERRFEIMSVHQDRKDYQRTCAMWLENLRRNRKQAEESGGTDLVDRYERYLDLCVRGWELGGTNLLRFAMRRIDNPRL